MNKYPFDKKACEIFTDNRALIRVEEQKKCYTAKNINKHLVCLARIDGCLITEGLKCDYLLLKLNDEKAYFIELKGSDLLHAIDQLDRSIEVLKAKILSFQLNARIVLSKVYAPDLKSNKFKRLEKKLMKSGGSILKKEKVLEEEI